MSQYTTYETVCVYAPDVQGDKLKKIEDKLNKIFTSHKVEEINRKDWGNRRFAYIIKRHKTGHYIQYVYNAPAQLLPELERNMGYEESILRFLTTKHTKHTGKNIEVEPTGFEIVE